MRIIIAAALLPLAAMLAAAKPVEPQSNFPVDAERSIWRATAAASCLGAMASDPDNRPANYGSVCTCAADHYLTGHPGTDLPRVDRDNFRTVLAAEIASCSGGETAPGGKTAEGDVVAPPVVEQGTPTSTPASSAKREDSGPWFPWLRNISMPSMGGIPSWVWWAMLGLVVFLFFARRIFRGDDSRSDLDGPPRSMKPSAPVQPRHPNLPPRG